MSYKQSNNPISRKTSPINKVNPYERGLGNTISEDKLDLTSGGTSVHKPSEHNPKLEGQPYPNPDFYERQSDMEESGADQPDYESDDYKPGMSRNSSSQETTATAQDSSFVKQNHPSFTGGYFSRTVNEMENRPDNLPKPTRKMDSDHIQSNKIREQRALGLAKNKGIDVENWIKSDTSSPLNDNTQKPSWMGQKSVNGRGDTRKSTASPKKPIVQDSISRNSSSPLNEIKPENRGKFTKWAKARGMTAAQAASKVMGDTGKYSSEVVKMANFAKNAQSW